MPRGNRARLWLALASLASLAGCMLFGSMNEEELPFGFDHAAHVEEGLECLDCHAGVEDTDEPGFPAKGQCMLCHSDIDEEKPPQERIDVLFGGTSFQTTGRTRLTPELVFSHQVHANGAYDCAVCHKGIEENKHVSTLPRLSMEDCMACHAEAGAPNDCKTCHTAIDEDWAPPSHAELWAQRHGQVFRAGSNARIDQCSLCHTDSTCVTCHAEEPPQSHNNFFRLRGHGLAAQMDRASCATCHRDDSCQRCHEAVLPVSHSGQWGGTRSTHCLVCHFPLPSNGCITCHKGTPSHLLATPLPSDPAHSPGLNCRQCHGVTAPLPHVDKGDECIACHR